MGFEKSKEVAGRGVWARVQAHIWSSLDLRRHEVHVSKDTSKKGLGSEKSKKVAGIRGWGIQEGSALNFNHIGKKHT